MKRAGEDHAARRDQSRINADVYDDRRSKTASVNARIREKKRELSYEEEEQLRKQKKMKK